jgi:hypothetical protein
MKAYSTKANARRAARQQLGEEAVEDQDFELMEIGEQYGYRVLVDGLADNTQGETDEAATGLTDAAPTAVTKPRTKSTVANPVQLVWALANSMPRAKRKDIIAACVEQGVAFYTARTQYQLWKREKKLAIVST